MKIFAIKDDTDLEAKALAYLIYYEGDKKFYIEIPDDADPWELPILLSAFVEKGETTMDDYWSRQWVQQRIVPTDRQNLTQILRDNGLEEYDEMALLLLANGRCEQDSYYIETVNSLPEDFAKRMGKLVEDILPLNDYELLVFFRDGKVKKYNAKQDIVEKRQFLRLWKYFELFYKVQIGTGGYTICWDENCFISNVDLYEKGTTIPLTIEDFKAFAIQRTLTGSEVCEELNCTRQNLSDLVKREKIAPLKVSGRTAMYLKSDVEERKW